MAQLIFISHKICKTFILENNRVANSEKYEKKNLEDFNILLQIKYSIKLIKFIKFAIRECTFERFITVK